MKRTVALLTLATLALTACGGGSDKPTVTATVTPTVSATPTPTATPTPSETAAPEPSTPADLAALYRDAQPITAKWRFPVTGLAEKDDVTDAITTLTPPADKQLALDVCGAVHSFLLDRDGGNSRVNVRVWDADQRLFADNLDGRCTTR